MTKEADFNAEEWSLLLEASPIAGMIVAVAERGGIIRESMSMARAYAEERQRQDGSELLTMAEAGEVGRWEDLGKLNEKAGDAPYRELVAWALPVQERHLHKVRQGSLQLAAEEDPGG